MLFALGYGLQDVLTPPQAETPVYEKDGITFSPDFELHLAGDMTCELKTTRMSLKTLEAGLAETWVEYIMGGCYIRKITSYELCVLLMMGTYRPPFPIIHSETLVFEQEELEENWQYILSRRDIYVEALAANKPPAPQQYCKSWESKNCRYKMMCQALLMVDNVDWQEGGD